jgi:hypothetical protein
MVAMSGTITKRSILDYAHIIRWCLGSDNAPIPKKNVDLELWADALDERKGQTKRADPGALRILCNQEEDDLWDSDVRSAARMAYRRRLVETPGVVVTSESPIDASIIIQAASPPTSTVVDQAFQTLRNKWLTPDGWPLADGLEVYRHAREMALGFFYIWDPRPPRDWMAARSDWCAVARAILTRSKTYDSEGQLKTAILDGTFDHPNADVAAHFLAEWLDIQDSFIPNTVPVWLDDSVLKHAAAWLNKNPPGIAWTEHTWFARELSKLSGCAYYGRKAQTDDGQPITKQDPSRSMICSIASCRTGQNLQAWSRNYILSPPPNALQTEQLMGRTHRDGQKADTVTFDIAMFCAEHVGAFWQSMRDADFTYTTTGSPQKLLLADHNIPTADDLMQRQDARWHKTSK